jgi:hypothetical protein
MGIRLQHALGINIGPLRGEDQGLARADEMIEQMTDLYPQCCPSSMRAAGKLERGIDLLRGARFEVPVIQRTRNSLDENVIRYRYGSRLGGPVRVPDGLI